MQSSSIACKATNRPFGLPLAGFCKAVPPHRSLRTSYLGFLRLRLIEFEARFGSPLFDPMKSSLLRASLLLACCLPLKAALPSGLSLADADPAVSCCNDLYRSVNGCWLERTEIPEDRSNYGAFTALDELSQTRIKDLLEQCAHADAALGEEGRKVGLLYRSILDEARLESLGMTPLQALVDEIQAIDSPKALFGVFGHLQRLGVKTPLPLWIGQDDRDSTAYLGTFYQSGLSMPDRDYYLKEDAKYLEARRAYQSFCTKVLLAAGYSEQDAASLPAQLLELETALAQAQRSKVELRDPIKNYNKMDWAQLGTVVEPNLLQAYFGGLGITAPASVNLGQPDFASALVSLVHSKPLSLWKAYLCVQAVDAYSVALPKSVQEASFDFHGRSLAGIPVDKPRWKTAVSLISGEGAGDFGVLGDVVGRLYVARYFKPEAKERMDVLVSNLMKAYGQSIESLTWMTPETKAKAADKLSKYMVKIGYPSTWRDYSGLQLKEGALLENLQQSALLESARNLSKLGKPVDRSEWGMTPQTVNAYYNPGLNEIVFPAAILQAPFFDANVDDAVNYGGIGAVIGHEISHGFDDQGSQYDGNGNLSQWWTEDDLKAFQELTSRLVAQYDDYEALPGKYVNGKLTLGENIADLSGLSIAYKAYRLSLAGCEAPIIDGLTGDQRFFMGWAQVWRRKYREAELLKRLSTDPHSPSEFRANGPVVNIDAFVKAFGVKPGDKLFKPESERIRIW